ncbi:MAG: hypothetical protein GAK35_02645 [Herbaspirillum frisingense]|uniref:Uncharacterized protein n=1 Tax=Herbaspirillum frisingense TaxID=92645 RepID=A0A7V8FVV7_9BURK|nr:MAG: hypothetical protein GAK35_02645 [Herbaspirillum frisingense]
MTAELKPDLVELKPCPFCGERPVFSQWSGRALLVLNHSCPAIVMREATGFPYEKARMASVWNRRTQLEAKEAPAVVDGLPPLPEPHWVKTQSFIDDQMYAYGRQCAAQAISQERASNAVDGQNPMDVTVDTLEKLRHAMMRYGISPGEGGLESFNARFESHLLTYISDTLRFLEKQRDTAAPAAVAQEPVAFREVAAGGKPITDWIDGSLPKGISPLHPGATIQFAYGSPPTAGEDEKDAEIARLNQIINNPQSGDFLRAVSTEGEHQRQRWGSSHDAGKAPADWFWLVGYLAGKALHAHSGGDMQKAEHHVITAAAALLNWHMAMFGKTGMRPGIGEAAIGAAKE